jgi:hypothetical protein
MIFVAALMMVQVAATPPASPSIQPAQIVIKKKKSKQVCQYVDVTGSRMSQRVCHDADGGAALDSNVTSDASDGMLRSDPGTPVRSSPTPH